MSGLNLHNIASGAISAITPPVAGTWQPSTGTTTVNFKQIPAYGSPQPIRAQVQPLTWTDLRQLDGINVQGQKVGIYVTGNIQGIVRADGKGGDLITLADGTLWLVVLVLEDYFRTAGWGKVAAVRQVAAP